MKPLRWIAFVAAAFVLASCNCVKEGVVVSKRARKGVTSAYADGLLRSTYEPDIYWVEVEGRNQHGKLVRKSVLLFRNDWSLIKVGDHWHCGQQIGLAKSSGDK